MATVQLMVEVPQTRSQRDVHLPHVASTHSLTQLDSARMDSARMDSARMDSARLDAARLDAARPRLRWPRPARLLHKPADEPAAPPAAVAMARLVLEFPSFDAE